MPETVEQELERLRAELAEAGRIIRLAVAKCGKSCIPCGAWLDDAEDWVEKEDAK